MDDIAMSLPASQRQGDVVLTPRRYVDLCTMKEKQLGDREMSFPVDKGREGRREGGEREEESGREGGRKGGEREGEREEERGREGGREEGRRERGGERGDEREKWSVEE